MTPTTSRSRRAPMQLAHGHAALTRRPRSPAVAIGNFDGVHRGHQRLFAEVIRLATARSGDSAVLTFEPHPARVLGARYAPPLITSLARKLELIQAAGIELCIVDPFDRALAAMSPEEFVDRVVVGALGAAHVCVGYDFTFGKDRGGGTSALAAIGAARGFGVTVIDPVTVDGIVCSSTKVREFVLEGRVDGAALLLGRDFELEGEVVRGAGRGRTIGVPTLNLRPATELLPRGGVYAGWAELDGTRRFDAAINIGTNPTFTGGAMGTAESSRTAAPSSRGEAEAPPASSPLSIEAHLLDFSGPDLYGQFVRLGISTRLRDEARFSSAEALVDQIGRDIAAAREAGRKRALGQASPPASEET